MSVYINVVERYIKIPLYIVLAVLFLLFAPNCIFADEIPENELRQPFRWKSAGEAFQYQITISTRNALTGLWEQCYYHETDREETDSCLIYIEPLLSPGNYRAEIKVVNILGLVQESLTSLGDFTVYQAYMPEIDSVSYPLNGRTIIYLDELDNDGVVKISGTNLFMPDSTRKQISFTDYFFKNEENTLFPEKIISHDEQNSKVSLQFDVESLVPGVYHLYAQDASGLHSLAGRGSEFEIKARKVVDFNIEAGYTCLFLNDRALTNYFEQTVFPLSAQARLSLFFLKRSWGYFGFGIRANYSYFTSTERTYSLDGNIGMAHFVLIYQLPMFRRRFFLELRGGVGGTYYFDIKFHFRGNVQSSPFNTISLCYDAGMSMIYYINKRLFIEALFDYAFTVNQNALMGGMLPSLGVGWQF